MVAREENNCLLLFRTMTDHLRVFPNKKKIFSFFLPAIKSNKCFFEDLHLWANWVCRETRTSCSSVFLASFSCLHWAIFFCHIFSTCRQKQEREFFQISFIFLVLHQETFSTGATHGSTHLLITNPFKFSFTLSFLDLQSLQVRPVSLIFLLQFSLNKEICSLFVASFNNKYASSA